MNAAAPLMLVDYWHIAVRRKWLIVGAILLSVAAAGVLCVALPKSYRSSTLIMVEEEESFFRRLEIGQAARDLTRTLGSHIRKGIMKSQAIEQLRRTKR